jgi:hypothetical protein
MSLLRIGVFQTFSSVMARSDVDFQIADCQSIQKIPNNVDCQVADCQNAETIPNNVDFQIADCQNVEKIPNNVDFQVADCQNVETIPTLSPLFGPVLTAPAGVRYLQQGLGDSQEHST